jgi:hypothetical protein
MTSNGTIVNLNISQHFPDARCHLEATAFENVKLRIGWLKSNNVFQAVGITLLDSLL